MAHTIISKKQLKETYDSYNPYFTEIMKRIVSVLQEKVHLSAQPTYKSRVKSFNSYYKKILRLKSDKLSQTQSIIYLTDIMGIRMICAFLEDINIAVEQLKSIFDIKEVEIKGADKSFSEFGYESIHVLIKIPDELKPELKDEFKNLAAPSDELLCEIQIRTILQDAWAEVEHELIYKTEFSPFDAPLRRKLASLNASLTLADITFQEIRDYQNKLQSELESRRKSFYSIADEMLNENDGEKIAPAQINRVTPFVLGTIDDMLLQAIHAHNEGNLDLAVSIYTKILETVPEKDRNVIAVIRKHRGMAYFAMNDFDSALKDFKISIEFDSKAFRTYYYEGIVYSIKKEYKKAVECFDKSLEINEFQAHTHFRRSVAYYELAEYEKSMNDLDTALRLGLDPAECKTLQQKLTKKLGLSM